MRCLGAYIHLKAFYVINLDECLDDDQSILEKVRYKYQKSLIIFFVSKSYFLFMHALLTYSYR